MNYFVVFHGKQHFSPFLKTARAVGALESTNINYVSGNLLRITTCLAFRPLFQSHFFRKETFSLSQNRFSAGRRPDRSSIFFTLRLSPHDISRFVWSAEGLPQIRLLAERDRRIRSTSTHRGTCGVIRFQL